MEKDRGSKVLAIFAICVAVIGMTVGFAAFSTTLKILGTGEVKSSHWSVIFDNLGSATITGTAIEKTAPTVQENGTQIKNYSVELSTPGDSISYNFKIKNVGTYDAIINDITMAGLDSATLEVETTTDPRSATADTDEENVENNLTYTLTYVVGGAAVAVGDTLAAGTEVEVQLKLTYATFDDESLLPKDSVTINNLGIDIDYIQD